MFDAVKNYLALASGVTEVTRQRALSAARALVQSGEATAEQVSNLADDLLTTSRNNRDTVLALVRYEVDRALTRLGLATSEEISSLAQRLASLESAVRDSAASAPVAPSSSSEPPAGAPSRPTKRATKAARKAPAKRSTAKRSPAKRVAGSATAGSSPRDTSSSTAPAKKAAAKQASPAKSAPAKGAAAKTAAPARKATSSDSS